MNTMTATTAALPTILYQPDGAGIGRRERVQDFSLDLVEVDRFNHLLARLGRQSAPLERDQLATAARQLCDRDTCDSAPPCIGQRMRRVIELSRMVADRDWDPANEAIDVASTVIDYVRGNDDLIPDRLRRIGRLDDAIVIETAWPQLATEVDDYVQYRRLHRLEASLRGLTSASFRFTRSDWETARAAEAALANHQRRVRSNSYLPAAAGLFQIH